MKLLVVKDINIILDLLKIILALFSFVLAIVSLTSCNLSHKAAPTRIELERNSYGRIKKRTTCSKDCYNILNNYGLAIILFTIVLI